jgi:hypothetical protein
LKLYWSLLGAALLAGVALGAAAPEEDVLAQPHALYPAPKVSLRWINPGENGGLAADGSYDNEQGQLGVLNSGGAVSATGHPFFAALGSNGRACVSCHQPQDAMSLSLNSIRRQWQVTNGQDPIFAAIDGANCPNLPQQEAASHSLLLDRGLFRVFLPWPPRDAAGKPIEPEFSIEVVRDPTGCNTHPQYGLNSAQPTVSVYRRPRPAANLKYPTHQNFGVSSFIGKNGLPTARDPDTGKPTSMNLMADARAPSLRAQAAGFRLAGRSEINANPRDTRDHVQGVWALPPTLRGGEIDRA